jgi:ribonucleoside-diphosphate reductase alpha subunit
MAMQIVKRSGERQDMLFDKVTERIKKLSGGLNVIPEKVAQKTFYEMYDGMKTSDIDDISADISANMMTVHPDYEILAARILVSNLHKTCPRKFSEFIANLSIASKDLNAHEFDEFIIPDRDYDFGYFGLKTMQKVYMNPGETPQYMFMRVAIGIHGYRNKEAVLSTYELLSTKKIIHATPTMINAGTNRPQMSSCFLTHVDDSITGIYENLSKCAHISKHAGGLGIHIQDIRSKGSRIKSNNGQSDGIVPMLRVYNATARYVNQSGKRKGSFAVYIEPWHADIMDFLELRLNQGNEDDRCRDLFTALWIPDIFMTTVETGGDWALFDPSECPGLTDTYGEKFNMLYTKYKEEGRAKKIVPSLTIWNAIIKSQIETGTPYMLYKDTCNARSNQRNLGTIKGSNLCTEIIEYTSPNEVAVCNLASISLPAFVRDGVFDFDDLHSVTKLVTRNLNDVIDRNYYPTEEARISNWRHRPIGIGIQGLADVFIMLNMSFESAEAMRLNSRIFQCMYHAALEQSVEEARKWGVYDTFYGSPASEGLLQFDLAGASREFEHMFDWNKMRDDVRQTGLRNSLLIAPMPTATTSQVLGNNECFEPYTSNLYLRRTLAGEFVVVNKHLVNKLIELGLWDEKMKNLIIQNNGSVQGIDAIPEDVRNIFKTVWEISPRIIINQAVQRGYFICQSQSMNLFVESPTIAKMSSIHMFTWKQGLKTGMYYLRTRPKASPIQVTIDPTVCTWEPGCKSCGA